MKKYTNRILSALYILGVLIVLAIVIIVRLRLDRIVEITV